jgi:AbiTii
MAVITNSAGYNGGTTRIDPSVFPAQIRETIDLEDAVLGEGIGVLEAMAGQGEDEHRLIPSWSSLIAGTLNQFHMAANSRVAEVYWSVSNASVRGVLVRVRTALAELVAELITLTPPEQEVPDKLAADGAVQFVITGDRTVIHYSRQQAADGGTNVTVASNPSTGTVAVAGAHGSATGSQAANGAHSAVAGIQAVQAGCDAATAGHEATVTGAANQFGKEGWWARLRKRGMIVAFATIVGAIAAVGGTIVGVCVWLGWKP